MEFNCLICKKTKHLRHKNFIFPQNNKYLIIRINLSEIGLNAQRLKSKITYFHFNKTRIPSTLQDFKIKIAIQHLPNDENNPNNGGHYVFWVLQNSNKWLRISDSHIQSVSI